MKVDYKDDLDDDEILYGKFFRTDKVFLKRSLEEIATMKNILETHQSAELEGKIARLEEVLKKVEK